jgi:hypothetical protein
MLGRATILLPPVLAVGSVAYAGGPVFRDVAVDSGVHYARRGAPEKRYIVESMSGGVALFDYDDDGLLDIYLVDSATVEGSGKEEAEGRGALFRNRGGWSFEDVTETAGLAEPGWGMGACVADFDGDGHRDLFVTGIGRNRLYRNLADGRFAEVAAAAGAEGGGWSAGCGFADFDRDGDLDLFVSRYLAVDLEHLPEFGSGENCQYLGMPVQCGPRGLPGEGDLLYRNDGAGRFEEVGAAAGLSDPERRFGLGVGWLDYDDDGWVDLYVANDTHANYLYRNLSDGTFEDVALLAGVALDENGETQGGMGVAVGDFGGDGLLSLFVTNFADEYNDLYRNEGSYFADVSFASGVGTPSLPYVGWGTAPLDYDNDGLLDLIAVNGHVYPQLEKTAERAGYRQRALLLHNLGDGRFEEVASEAAPTLLEDRASRGLAVGDLDNDGGLDVVVNDIDGPPQLFRNEAAGRGHWLLVKLRGGAGNVDAVGAVIDVNLGSRRLRRIVQSGTGYLSQDDFRQHFGLGDAESVGWVEVRWPDGTRSRELDVAVDRILEIEKPR